MKIVRFVSLLVIIICSALAQARWAVLEDAPIEFEYFNRDLIIADDGKAELITECRAKIINEQGRSNFGTLRLSYNGDVQELKVIEAKTIYQGKEYKVPASMIEIKPLASEIKGFDQRLQTLISFPQVVPSAILCLKYKLITKKQPLTKYYADVFAYGERGMWKKSKLTIKSKLPFNIITNDPRNHLIVKEGTNKGYQTLEVDLKEGIFEAHINEPYGSIVNPDSKTWVSVSTLKNHEEIAKGFAAGFQNVIDQPLPPLLEDIRKAAAHLTDPVDQINKVTSLLSESIRYMGDWRSIKGQYAPRSLKEISATGFGDCKDFTATTAAILNTLGYKAYAALVTRGYAYQASQRILPSVFAVNHAMVKVIDKAGKVFWIDPTNLASMADGIFPDIAHRPAYICNPDSPSFEMIPNIDPQHAAFIVESNLNIKSDTFFRRNGQVILRGEQALEITAATLTNSLQAVEELIYRRLSGETSPLNKKLVLPDLKSREVKEIIYDYEYDQENEFLLTNYGYGINLDSYLLGSYTHTSDDQIGDLYVGSPHTYDKKIRIKNVSVDNIEGLQYNLKTPWVEAGRICFTEASDVIIHEKIVILKSFISNEDLKSSAFKDFKSSLKQYCQKVAVIVKKQ